MNEQVSATLESIQEHIESAMTAVAQSKCIDPREFRKMEHQFGTPAYHLKAAQEACCRLFQQLSAELTMTSEDYD